MKKATKYISDDNVPFDTEEECREYEKQLALGLRIKEFVEQTGTRRKHDLTTRIVQWESFKIDGKMRAAPEDE